MASLGSLFAETMIRLLVRPPATAEAGERAVHAAALRPAPFGPPKRLRRDVSLEFAFVNGWTIYTVAPTVKAADKAVIYLHGGAFYGEITAFHWRLIARIAAEAGTRVVVPIYPLVPRGTAREVVEGVAAITIGEVERLGSQAVSLCGDSAGGNIALAVALYLKDSDIRLRRTVLIHPAVDLTLTNPTIAVVEREDPMLRAAALRPNLRAMARSAGPARSARQPNPWRFGGPWAVDDIQRHQGHHQSGHTTAYF